MHFVSQTSHGLATNAAGNDVLEPAQIAIAVDRESMHCYVSRRSEANSGYFAVVINPHARIFFDGGEVQVVVAQMLCHNRIQSFDDALFNGMNELRNRTTLVEVSEVKYWIAGQLP